MAIRTNELYIGSVSAPDFYFINSDIKSISATLNAGIVADELAIDQLTVEVYALSEADAFIPRESDGLVTADGDTFICATQRPDYSGISYATPIWWYADGSLFLKFYVSQVARVSRDVWQINAVSAIGILDSKRHYGGIYRGTTFTDILTEIIGTDFAFSVAPDLALLPIYGWLPIESARDNIHQLLLAAGAALDKDANGEMYFKFLSGANPLAVADDNIYYGGEVDYNTPATKVEVTEHSYFATANDKLVTLFDNTDSAASAVRRMVTFKNPAYGLYAEGNLTIDEQGANYAIVTGLGWLYGYEYSQSEEVVAAEVENPTLAPKTVEVTDAYLVSLVNSRNVAERLLAYYSAIKTVSLSLVNSGEKPNDLIMFTNPFDEQDEGFISQMSVQTSSFVRGDCEIITGYEPTNEGNNFSNYIVLTGSGTWTNNTGATYGRIIAIGGGTGGSSGERGEQGGMGRTSSGGKGGNGGKGGSGGNGGKIDVYDGELPTSATYTCGTGGAGAPVNTETEAVEGAEGTYTLFTGGEVDLDTRSGVVPANGIYNLISGDVYATQGASGENGGAGGKGGDNGQTYADLAKDGESVGTHIGGDGADTIVDSGVVYGGGGGGGASYDNDGGDGGEPYNDGVSGWFGGNGGAGGAGNTTAASSTVYGAGGSGGNGGGGGGGGGKGSTSDNVGFPGAPGAGGCGGAGGDGAIIIFY